jgi:hypothetical protein
MSNQMDDSGTPMTPEEATAFLRKGYFASVTWINELPPYYGVNIVQVGCKFIDDDGHNDNKAANVNIPGGGQSYTLTTSYEGCCRSYIAVSKARAAADGREWNFVNPYTVEPNYCGTNLRIRLRDSSKVQQGTSLEGSQFQMIVEEE